MQVQVDNAFLLGLGAEYAIEWQTLKDSEDELKQLQRTAKSGSFRALIGSVGELEAAQVRLHGKASREGEELQSFRVHPQYAELQQQANALTQQLVERRHANLGDQRMLELYETPVTPRWSLTSRPSSACMSRLASTCQARSSGR